MWSGSRWRPEATKDLRLPPPDELPRWELLLLLILQNESRFDMRSCCPSQARAVSETLWRAGRQRRLDDHDYMYIYNSRWSLWGTGRSACLDCFLVLNIKHTIHESNKTQKFWYQLLAPSYRLSLLSLSGLNSKHTVHGEHGWRLHKERRRTYMMNWIPYVMAPDLHREILLPSWYGRDKSASQGVEQSPASPQKAAGGGRPSQRLTSGVTQPTHNRLNPYYNDSIITYSYNATTKVSFTDDSDNHESSKHWYNVSLHYNEADYAFSLNANKNLMHSKIK